MKLETKQTEVRLVAESDIDKFYLENFFKDGKKLYFYKEYEVVTDDTYCVTLTHQKP
jgi:hypothetical protein